MESLFIDKTAHTPTVYFDLNSGIFEIEGRSIPENSLAYYQPIFEWLDKYSKAPLIFTNVKISLEYVNTSSSICLLDILRKFESINSVNNQVSINWYCEDDDEEMFEIGEEYKSILRMPFCVLKISKQNYKF